MICYHSLHLISSRVTAPCRGRLPRTEFSLYLVAIIVLLASPSWGHGSASAMSARNENSSSGTIARTPQENLRLGDAYLTGKGVPKDPAREIGRAHV